MATRSCCGADCCHADRYCCATPGGCWYWFCGLVVLVGATPATFMRFTVSFFSRTVTISGRVVLVALVLVVWFIAKPYWLYFKGLVGVLAFC